MSDFPFSAEGWVEPGAEISLALHSALHLSTPETGGHEWLQLRNPDDVIRVADELFQEELGKVTPEDISAQYSNYESYSASLAGTPLYDAQQKSYVSRVAVTKLQQRLHSQLVTDNEDPREAINRVFNVLQLYFDIGESQDFDIRLRGRPTPYVRGKFTPVPAFSDTINKLLADHPDAAEDIRSAIDFLESYYDTHPYYQSTFTRRTSESFLARRITLACRKNMYVPGTIIPVQGAHRQFWTDLYVQRTGRAADGLSNAGRNRFTIFSPNINGKQPDELLDSLLELDSTSPEQFFKLDSDLLERGAYDSFRAILREAGSNGWSNAQVLHDKLDELPKRDLPLSSIIIHLGNLVTTAINQQGISEQRLARLKPTEIANTPEALDRCMYAIFEFGHRPDADEGLNYMITAEIINRIYEHIAIKASSASATESTQPTSLEEQARLYRETLAKSRSKRTFWTKWKEGYGLFS